MLGILKYTVEANWLPEMVSFSLFVDTQITYKKSMTQNVKHEKSPGFRSLNAQILLPTLQLFHCVTVGKMLNLSGSPLIKQGLDTIMPTILYNFYIL